MSLKATMHLNMDSDLQARITKTHKTANQYLEDLINSIETKPLQVGLIFRHEVFFMEIGQAGFYTGTIASHFWAGRNFYVKTTSGEVIRMSFF